MKISVATGLFNLSIALALCVIAILFTFTQHERALPANAYDKDSGRLQKLAVLVQSQPGLSSLPIDIVQSGRAQRADRITFVIISPDTSSEVIPTALSKGLNAAYDRNRDIVLVSPALVELLPKEAANSRIQQFVALLLLHEIGHREAHRTGSQSCLGNEERCADSFAVRQIVSSGEVQADQLVEQLWNIAEGPILALFTSYGPFDPVTDYASHGSFFVRIANIYKTLLEAEVLSKEDRVFAIALQRQVSLFVENTTRFHHVLELPRGRVALASLICGDQVRIFDGSSGIYFVDRDSISNGGKMAGELVRLKAVDVTDGMPISIRNNYCIRGNHVVETDDGNWLSEQSLSAKEVRFVATSAPGEDHDHQIAANAEIFSEGEGVQVSWMDPVSSERRSTYVQPIGLYAALGSFNKVDGLTLHVALDDETGCIAFDLAGRFFAIVDSAGQINFVDNYLAGAQLAVGLGQGYFLTAIPYSRFIPVLSCAE